MSFLDDLLAQIPDRPEWVETRWILESGRARVDGLGRDAALVSDRVLGLGSVVGDPSLAELLRVLGVRRQVRELLIQEASPLYAATIPGWQSEVVLIYFRNCDSGGMEVPDVEVRELDPLQEDLPDGLSDEVVRELRTGLVGPVAVSVFEGDLTAICYVAAQSEKLWDASVETLPAFRRRGHARACAAALIGWMSRRGKSGVWGAVESNIASQQLARSLGYREVARLRYLHR